MGLDRGGFSLYYEIAGAGPETVVLTHGLGSSGATWSALVAALAPRYRVVTWERTDGRAPPTSRVRSPCSAPISRRSSAPPAASRRTCSDTRRAA